MLLCSFCKEFNAKTADIKVRETPPLVGGELQVYGSVDRKA